MSTVQSIPVRVRVLTNLVPAVKSLPDSPLEPVETVIVFEAEDRQSAAVVTVPYAEWLKAQQGQVVHGHLRTASARIPEQQEKAWQNVNKN